MSALGQNYSNPHFDNEIIYEDDSLSHFDSHPIYENYPKSLLEGGVFLNDEFMIK